MATAAETLSPSGDTLDDAFRRDVLAGLAQERKAIPARWLYDHRGSELFEQITAVPEYYPTRTEVGIFESCCPQIARETGRGRTVVEFGAGSATKTPLLLDHVAPSAYVPIDISGEFLRESCATLQERYPDLPIHAVEADFMEPVALPRGVDGALLGFFPGSTIGNMAPPAAVDLLRSMRATLGDEALLLIGMDRIKDQGVLEAAYDDEEGVTAAFNRNLVRRINRELDGTIPEDAIRHEAIWNADLARVEMHLVAERAIAFEVDGQRFAMSEGETIHTENSHKYDRRSATMLLLSGGWTPQTWYADADDRFMVVLARATVEGVTA